jgi:hypothetical protein
MYDDLFDSTDVYRIFQILQDRNRFNSNLWRMFHCACVRDIWPYVEDARSRHAVEIAELYINGLSDKLSVLDEFAAAREAADEAWQIVQSLREPGEQNEWQWSVSQQIDEAWSRYCAASASKDCLLLANDAVLITTVPDSAASVRPWINARLEVLAQQPQLDGEMLRKLVIQRWDQIKREEDTRQARLLLKIIRA